MPNGVGSAVLGWVFIKGVIGKDTFSKDLREHNHRDIWEVHSRE